MSFSGRLSVQMVYKRGKLQFVVLARERPWLPPGGKLAKIFDF